MKAWLLELLFVLAFAVCPQSFAQTSVRVQGDVNTLVRLLLSKGILTPEDAASIDGGAPEKSLEKLLKLLVERRVISQDEDERILGHPRVEEPDFSASGLVASAAPILPPAGANAEPRVPESSRTLARTPADAPAAQAPARGPEAQLPPAIAPLRVLPITVPKKEGLIPDIKLGAGALLRPYGFFKASAVEQTASNGGRIFGSNDFPIGPLFIGGDTGPDGDPQVHIKNRQLRLGVDFEWPDPSKNVTVTGKLEFDFEGNFTDVNNRNISSNRSSQPSLRLAWVRLDTKAGKLPVFVQFGQDWSIFGSSTLMDLFETTGFGFAQGNLYERMPMFRTGVQFGSANFKIQPEFAIALPSFGEPGLDTDERLRFGGRVGPESNQPEIQSRIVFQFPVSRAPGVLPAQLIFSHDHAQRAEIIDGSSLTGVLRNAFPDGLKLTSNRNAWSAEFQLPTSYATLVGKYYRGGDLRYYFMGQFNDVFADLGGLPSIGTVTSYAGRTIPFAMRGSQVMPATLEPVMGQGGFLQLGLPLSRIFQARPDGRAAGWSTYLTYGIDTAFAKDAARANGLRRTDHGSVQLRYKLNRWLTFVHEETYLDTRTAGSQLKLFRGIPSRTTHAWRSEFGTIVVF